ncbi:RadC family protein [Roseivirga sp.]|uniref:RadC family protein n=1 Tax=Roseivirga sp. TaxID=1964215 RepID=UPI003B8CFBB0
MDGKLKILDWAQSDRPREKLQEKGKSALTDAELIAILLGSGSRKQSAVDLAKEILLSIDNDLNNLAKLTLPELEKFNGIGEAKAIAIVSALELGRRRKQVSPNQRLQIKNSQTIYDLMIPELLDQPTEQFWIINLNRSNTLISKKLVSLGGISGTLVDPKVVFKIALENFASSIILVHNHPSGNLKASRSDIRITERIKDAGKLLEISVIDHIIFTDQGYFSFSDEGLL